MRRVSSLINLVVTGAVSGVSTELKNRFSEDFNGQSLFEKKDQKVNTLQEAENILVYFEIVFVCEKIINGGKPIDAVHFWTTARTRQGK